MGNAWRDARSIGDLGQLMAQWLEGRIPSWPGYDGPFGQEEQDGARHLIPTLAAVNRGGFVTTDSQPAYQGRGYDGAYWRQRAYVTGIVDSRSPLMDRLQQAATSAGMTVVRGTRRPSTPVVFTERDGQPHTGISTKLRRDQLARDWHGIGRSAMRELRVHGVHLTLMDPVWGRDDRLWPALREAVQ